MGLRIDASSDSLSRSSALTITSFTLMGWAQIVSDLGSTTFQCVAQPQVSGNAFIAWGWSTNNGSASTSELGSWNGSTWTAVNLGSRPAVGDWFHWYIKCAGTGANQLEVGWKRLQDASYVTATTTLGSGITGSATAYLSTDPNNFFYSNCRHAAVKGYSGALSATDIEAERLTFTPRNTTNLLFAIPMVHPTVADSVKDFSGLGANFTSAGTLTVEGGPPIQFGNGRRLRIIPTATTNKTLTADAGSYSLSGTAAVLRHGWVLPAAAGSYALTGTAASLEHGYKVGAGVGSYALTGTAAALRKTWMLPASAGSYSLTGTAAGLKHAWILTAGAGSYALSGTAAGLKHGWNLPAGSGSYALSGTDAGLVVTSTAKSILASPGSYSLSGTAASVLHGWKLAAGAGSYSLSGTAATLAHGWVLSAGSGSYAITGQPVAFVRAWKIPASPGSYSLSGSSVSLEVGRMLAAGAGSYSLSGTAAALLMGKKIPASAGSYQLSGSDVTLTAAGTVGSSGEYHNLPFIASVGPMTAH